MPLEDEQELIERAQAGDDAAFDTLVARYLPSIYRFITRFTGKPDLAEDAAQETFVKAWRNIRRFDSTRPLAPWLLQIARNAATDLLRKEKRTLPFAQMETDDGMSFAETEADTEPRADELFARAESAGHVRKALAQLAPREQALLALRYDDELPFEDIANILGLPASTARSIHRRALARLRDAFEGATPEV
jgi:RNA polymerase sigma-70 factor (ECF subfamily)